MLQLGVAMKLSSCLFFSMRRSFLINAVCILASSGCVHATAQWETCESNPRLQGEKSAELLKLVKEDRADRSGSYVSIDWNKVNFRDLRRRIEVADIFAEACFKSAADYASAALIFQHGNTADHYYQAFLWANEAVKLGDELQTYQVANGLDRYLVAIGHKQLFGTQFSSHDLKTGTFCLQPVESSFPESRRSAYIKMSREDYNAFVLKTIGSTQSPRELKICDTVLKASPEGTVPGFW